MRRRLRRRAALATAVLAGALAAGLAGCGHPAVSSQASQALSAQVQQLRTDAANEDQAAAGADLDRLRAMVQAYERAGQVSGTRAQQILAAVSEASGELSALAPPTTIAPLVEQPVPATPVGHGKGGDHHPKGGDG